MNKPKTFVNGRGETICSTCAKELQGGKYCDCNRHGYKGTIRIPFHIPLPNVGDILEVVRGKQREVVNVKVTLIKSLKWWHGRGLEGIELEFIYSIEEFVKSGRPKLELVKREEGTG